VCDAICPATTAGNLRGCDIGRSSRLACSERKGARVHPAGSCRAADARLSPAASPLAKLATTLRSGLTGDAVIDNRLRVGAVSGTNPAGAMIGMSYIAPTTNEIHLLIKKFWQADRDPVKRARAVDRAFLNLRVHQTQRLMERLIRSGLRPIEAERQAMREVALAD